MRRFKKGKRRKALKVAQGRAGVTADGIYGPRTANAIDFPYRSDETGAVVACRDL